MRRNEHGLEKNLRILRVEKQMERNIVERIKRHGEEQECEAIIQDGGQGHKNQTKENVLAPDWANVMALGSITILGQDTFFFYLCELHWMCVLHDSLPQKNVLQSKMC